MRRFMIFAPLRHPHYKNRSRDTQSIRGRKVPTPTVIGRKRAIPNSRRGTRPLRDRKRQLADGNSPPRNHGRQQLRAKCTFAGGNSPKTNSRSKIPYLVRAREKSPRTHSPRNSHLKLTRTFANINKCRHFKQKFLTF